MAISAGILMKTAAPNDKGQEEFVGIDVGKARPMNLEAVPRIMNYK